MIGKKKKKIKYGWNLVLLSSVINKLIKNWKHIDKSTYSNLCVALYLLL